MTCWHNSSIESRCMTGHNSKCAVSATWWHPPSCSQASVYRIQPTMRSGSSSPWTGCPPLLVQPIIHGLPTYRRTYALPSAAQCR